MKKNIFGNLLLVVIPSIIIIFIAEVTLRVVLYDSLSLVEDERALLYSHHDSLGWFPIPNSVGTYKIEKEISIRHNSSGFRGEEHSFGENNRMLVLGDSFVWGFDVEEEDRFTNKLNERLEYLDVYNLGVSGYGTDQEFLLLQDKIEQYEPNIVFLLYCTANDKLDNTQNLRYRQFYKPFYTPDESGALTVQGIPVPKGPRYYFGKKGFLFESYIVRLAVKTYYTINHPAQFLEHDPTFELIQEMRGLTEEHGSKFVVGLQKGDALLEQYLESQGIDYINVENNYTLGLHWTPEGHSFVADKIEEHLKKMDIYLAE